MFAAPADVGPVAQLRQVFYSGRIIDATPGNRTAIAVDLTPGMVLVEDIFDDAQGDGLGRSYSRPVTGFLTGRKVIVAQVPPASRRGGWITVYDGPCDLCPALVLANATAGATQLGVTTGQFHLVALTAVANVIDLGSYVGTARVTSDTSGAAAIRNISFRPLH